MRRALLLLCVGVTSVAGCAGKSPDPSTPATAAATQPAADAPAVENVSLADVGLDADRLDRSADPCEDFYQFACGGWLAKTDLPADEPYWGTFVEIARRNETLLQKILDDAAKGEGGGDPVVAKLGAFYGGCMDEAAIEKAGLSSLEPVFATTRKVRDLPSLWAAVTALHADGISVVFEIYSRQDKKNATKVIVEMSQGGLGLPERDYYLSDDEGMVALRNAYRQHVEKTLVHLGRKPAAAKKGAAAVLALETDLARSHKPIVEMRDEHGTYNKVARDALAGLAPGLAWDPYFQALGIASASELNLTAPGAIQALPVILKKHKPAVWRDYFDVQVVGLRGIALPKKIDEQNFAMQKLLTGQQEQRARWKRCVSLTNAVLSELVAQPYVKLAFAGESKTAAEQMVRQIVAAFDANLGTVEWMDEPTRARAREKLGKVDLMIGYPDAWRVYDFEIARDAFGASLARASRWEKARDLAKVGKPVNRKEWEIPPAMVNAYYHAALNQMVFPAGILQPPFYDVKSSVGVNLGAIGMIVGHELTHGFDDQGALYDGDGNLSGWWPEEVMKGFEERTQCMSGYYAQYEALPGLHLNGDLTNGENIADVGGTKLAYHAYRAVREKAPRRFVADGFTEDQQFFLALGQAWCEKSSDEFMKMLVATDPHSPPRFRVIGTVSSLPEFGDAFACRPGSKMRPEKICKVW